MSTIVPVSIILLIGLLLLPLVLVPVILGIRHARVDRELEHAERMKALELGRSVPREETGLSPSWVCVAIGAGVPVGVFISAWMATESVGYQQGVWFGATVVGTTAVVSGAVLAARQLNQRSLPEVRHEVKPTIDEDAFDVAGRRG